MRPRLASRPYGGCQTHLPGRCGSSAPSSWRLRSSWCGRGRACPYGTVWRDRTLPALTDIFNAKQKPARARGFFYSQVDLGGDLPVVDDDDASSGGANDGGDASPNAGDANGGGANPSAGGASCLRPQPR